MVLIAAIGAVASYIDNYYTESVGQWVANDLRMPRLRSPPAPLARLLRQPPDRHDPVSTITDDVETIQNFASSGTLSILVDLLTIVGMLGMMFWLNWDFALIAVAVTPFLLLFVARFKKAVKKATHEVRKHQSDIVAVVQQGLESVRVVKAFGAAGHRGGAPQGGQPGDGRGGAQGAAGQVAALARRLGHRRGAVHGVRALARARR